MAIFKISDLLGKLFNKKKEGEQDYLTIAEIMYLLRERGFGIMIIIFALPNLVPAFVAPIPTLFAVPLSIFSIQMIMGFDTPRLPGIISRRKLKRSRLQAAITRSLPYIHRIESCIRPRYEFMANRQAEQYLGVFMLIFSLTIAIPLPMTNLIPAIALLFMGGGIISRDGLFVMIGLAIGIVWLFVLFILSQELLELLNTSDVIDAALEPIT
ncbi:MAG: exopolysaccharide biosynthesis protein [Sphaerospermopsis sp. SIO1G2]|nr:exopolysaccharide biosynthesis protein [Sphaerospermopsis sp. SIO1G2]